MNSRDGKKPSSALRICFSLVLLLVVVFVGGFFYNVVSNHRMAGRINKEYSAVTLPTALHLQQKSFQGTQFLIGAPASGVGYTYTYKVIPEQSVRQIHAAIASSLENSGYIVPVDANPDPNANQGILSATGKKLQLSVLINAIGDSNNPDAAVNDVEMSAYE